MTDSTLGSIGDRNSILGARFVGLMRVLGGTAAVGAGVAGGALAWAYRSARHPVLRHYDALVADRPGLQPLQILHISDLHMFQGQDFIPRFLQQVAAEEKIDLVVSTGDNLGAVSAAPDLLDALAPLLSLPGVFVLGSNDYYSPDRKAWTSYLTTKKEALSAADRGLGEPDLPWVEVSKALTSAGWLDLSNQNGFLHVPTMGGSREQPVAFMGVDDPHILRDRMPSPGAKWRDENSLRLALTHSPYRRVLDRFAAEGADLIFAGHTHGGQVRVPGVGAIVNNSDVPRRYSRGMAQWPEAQAAHRSWLHVSAGLGTSEFAPIRFACRPEVSLIRVCPFPGC